MMLLRAVLGSVIAIACLAFAARRVLVLYGIIADVSTAISEVLRDRVA